REYVRYQESLGHTIETNTSMVPWDALPEDDKESNRRQADHVGHKLRAVDCGVRSLTDWLTPLVDFTDDEVETLAEMEHDRWAAARQAEGWKPGPRDRKRKRHPHLVEWADLDRKIREYDRHFARMLPSVLARAGFRVYRLPAEPRATTPVVAEEVVS
ncbi:MAG: RyR domain-containing protein, partial [Gaiellales bacterium]